MRKVKNCQFNIDTAMVDVVFENGDTISIYTVDVENEFCTTMASRSKLDWLIYNEPLTYVNLILSGEMQEYLYSVSNSQNGIESNICKSLEKNNYTPQQAREIAREFMMYDS